MCPRNPGWKVGWIVAPPDLAEPIAKAHQFVTYSTAPNLQAAVAYGLGKPPDDLGSHHRPLRRSARPSAPRPRGTGLCDAAGRRHLFPVGRPRRLGIDADDVAFCERAVREAGVAAIPVSAFYAENPVTNVVRLCFAKKPETLDEGIALLGKARAPFAD